MALGGRRLNELIIRYYLCDENCEIKRGCGEGTGKVHYAFITQFKA